VIGYKVSVERIGTDRKWNWQKCTVGNLSLSFQKEVTIHTDSPQNINDKWWEYAWSKL